MNEETQRQKNGIEEGNVEGSADCPIGYLLISDKNPEESGVRGKWAEHSKVWIRVE